MVRLAWPLAALGSLLVFALLLTAVQTGWQPLFDVDQDWVSRVHSFAGDHPQLVHGMRAVSALGTFPVYGALVVILVVILVRRGRGALGGLSAAVIVGSSLLNTAVKVAVGRPRPVWAEPVAQASSSSFPSGHAQAVVVASCVVLLIIETLTGARPRKAFVALATVWAVVMCASRVVLGVHFVSDIVAGAALGIAWFGMLRGVLMHLQQPRGGSPVATGPG